MSDCDALLAFGRFGRTQRIDLGLIAEEASLELEILDNPQDAAAWLSEHRPRALLLDTSALHAGEVCLEARAHAEQALTPIISLSRELNDLSFADVFSWGGDDAVSLSATRPLLSRVRALPTDLAPVSESRNTRGTVVIADPDRWRRLVRARVLRNAGYNVQFAVGADDAMTLAGQDTALIVMDSELDSAAARLAESARAHPKTLHILLCAPRELAVISSSLAELPNAAAADGFSPPENLIFLANELERGGTNDQRSSHRLLYGTKVAFRDAGRDTDDFGFSYNISEGGLYVRTLAPPKEDVVWLELLPPRSDRLVRIEGQVVWRRSYGPSAHATVPPGFGVKILDATSNNRKTWDDGYAQFLQSLGRS